MAIISITFDTKEKTLAVTRDGNEVPNVVGAYLGQSYDDPDDYRCELCQMEEDEAEGVRTMTRLVASEHATDVQKKAVGGVESLPGFILAGTSSDLQADVSAFLGRGK